MRSMVVPEGANRRHLNTSLAPCSLSGGAGGRIRAEPGGAAENLTYTRAIDWEAQSFDVCRIDCTPAAHGNPVRRQGSARLTPPGNRPWLSGRPRRRQPRRQAPQQHERERRLRFEQRIEVRACERRQRIWVLARTRPTRPTPGRGARALPRNPVPRPRCRLRELDAHDPVEQDEHAGADVAGQRERLAGARSPRSLAPTRASLPRGGLRTAESRAAWNGHRPLHITARRRDRVARALAQALG